MKTEAEPKGERVQRWQQPSQSLLDHLRRLTSFREFMILAIVIAGCLFMWITTPIFMTFGNWSALLLQVSVECIVAIGMTILLVSGGFDLSVGSTFALAGAVTAMAMSTGLAPWAALLVGLGAGALIGFSNGFIIAIVGINPFVTTLAMMSMVRGMLLVITRGRNISGLPESFRVIGQGNVHGVQNPIWIALLMVLIGDVLLRKSRFLRQNYYLGGNERAAMLSGIRIDRLKIFNYALTGLLAAFAGIIMTARLGAASVTAGTGLELKVISAVIIGGASLKGGEGTILGSFLGSLLMGILVGALTILGVDVYWNTFVIGATLLLAVLVDTLGRYRRKLQ
ncbi:MAG TPA: ABC transporter permease [Chthoniobacterales bacterium]|nr:ABC transporter permease [Chthoniobacterales bacterium]